MIACCEQPGLGQYWGSDNNKDLLFPPELLHQFHHVAELFSQNLCFQHVFEAYRNSLNPRNFQAGRRGHFFNFFSIQDNFAWKWIPNKETKILETVSDTVDIFLSEYLKKGHSSKKHCISPCWIKNLRLRFTKQFSTVLHGYQWFVKS